MPKQLNKTSNIFSKVSHARTQKEGSIQFISAYRLSYNALTELR